MITIRIFSKPYELGLIEESTIAEGTGGAFILEPSAPDVVLAREPDHSTLFFVHTNAGNKQQEGLQIDGSLVDKLIQALSPPCRQCRNSGYLDLPGMER